MQCVATSLDVTNWLPTLLRLRSNDVERKMSLAWTKSTGGVNDIHRYALQLPSMLDTLKHYEHAKLLDTFYVLRVDKIVTFQIFWSKNYYQHGKEKNKHGYPLFSDHTACLSSSSKVPWPRSWSTLISNPTVCLHQFRSSMPTTGFSPICRCLRITGGFRGVRH